MSSLPLPRRLLALAALLAAAVSLRAHDPYEITASTQLRADRLELVVVMARSTAALASGKTDEERRRFAPEDFEKVRPRLLACAPELFAFRQGDRPLAPRTTDVTLAVEDDIEFRLTFARPAAGKITVLGKVFARLPDEPYGSTFFVHGEKGELLANKFINAADPTVETVVPGAAAPKP